MIEQDRLEHIEEQCRQREAQGLAALRGGIAYTVAVLAALAMAGGAGFWLSVGLIAPGWALAVGGAAYHWAAGRRGAREYLRQSGQ